MLSASWFDSAVQRAVRLPSQVRSRLPFAAAGFALACGLAGCARETDQGTPPNILLISLDSTRRDQLGCYGRRSPFAPELSPSPHLDGLAERGMRFTDAYSTTSWTLPSHLSLLSGNPELVHGVDLDSHAPASELPRLPELLQRAGYRTAGFFSGPYLEADFGFARGFDVYARCYGKALMRAVERQAKRREERAQAGPAAPNVKVDALSHRDVSSVKVTDSALAEIDAAASSTQPWFVFAHYFDPHYDYIPPAPFDTQFDPDYAGAINGEDFHSSPAISSADLERPGRRIRNVSDRDLDHVRALYDGEMAWTDSHLGRLFARLDELSITDNTIVVVVADHGDEFFEHDGIGHRRTLHEEVTQVPLIVSWPGQLPEGGTVAGVTSLTGVAATLLELAGLECPESVEPSFANRLRNLQATSDSSAIGRLVATSVIDLRLRGTTTKAQLVEVREAYWFGDIKISRRRTWPEVSGALAAGVDAVFREQQQAMYSDESLSWIDLGQSASEQLDGYSTDFSAPQAARALERFQADYARLLERRHAFGGSTVREGGDEFSAQLEALGYASSAGLEQGRDRLLLPPPALPQ